MTKVVLLVNTGTPDRPVQKSVKKFLRAFLHDKRVIDIPWIFRRALVDLVIIPSRIKKITALYKKLWTAQGSPIAVNLKSLAGKLQDRLSAEQCIVYGVMRYGEPSLDAAMETIKNNLPDEIILLPLFPQYASSTSGSVTEFFSDRLKGWNTIPDVRIIDRFHNHPAFIKAFSDQVLKYSPSGYDHMLFSFHGLPLRHIRSQHPGADCDGCNCENEMPVCGKWCYKAACYETARLMASSMNIPRAGYSVGFQSRLSGKWLSPFTDDLIKSLAGNGVRRLLVAAPSFVSDCLETLIEIEQEYSKIFLLSGGGELTLVHSLNDSDEWVKALTEILTVIR